MDDTDWDKLLDEIGRYNNSPEITPGEIAQDDALHNLDKRFLMRKYRPLVTKRIISRKALEVICTIISDNNYNFLKAIGFSRHRSS